MQWSWINEVSWHHRLVIIIQVKGATKLCFMHYSYVVIILFNTVWSAFSNFLLRKLIALSFCAFCVYFWCAEFDVIFLNFYNTCIFIVYIVCIRCFCSHLLEANCKNVKKNWLQLLIQKHTSRELLSFKNFIYKEKRGYSQNERV